MQEYQQLIQAFIMSSQNIQQHALKVILETTKVPLQLFQNTAKFYMSNPEYAPEIEEMGNELETKYKKNEDVPFKKLDKDETIAAIRQLEEAKVNSIRSIQNGVRARQI